jgi:hypothetical protein
METPRRRAQINGLYVTFESRNPKLATVRWHSRFKLRYRTKADGLAAKQAWEQKGRIKFPGWPWSAGCYTTTLSLIASFGACTKSCFVPRYRSVV